MSGPADPYQGRHAENLDGVGDRAEAEVATPPRGIDRPEPARAPAAASGHELGRSWAAPESGTAVSSVPLGPGAVSTASSTTIAPRRSRRLARVGTAIALVLGLAGTAWFATDYLRNAWLQNQPVSATVPDASGTATLDGLSVSLVEAVDLGQSPTLPGSDWRPPTGFHAWRVTLASESTNADLSSCDVVLIDDRAREFKANVFVDSFVEGYEFSYSCGVPEPDDDVGPEQALLVLVPEDADLQVVRITNRSVFGPSYIELPLG